MTFLVIFFIHRIRFFILSIIHTYFEYLALLILPIDHWPFVVTTNRIVGLPLIFHSFLARRWDVDFRASLTHCYFTRLNLKKINFDFQHCYEFIGTLNKNNFWNSVRNSWDNLIFPLKWVLDRTWDIFWIKSNNGTFIGPQMKSFGLKRFQNPCKDQKVPFRQFLRKGRDGRALKNPSQDFKKMGVPMRS